MGEFVSYMMQVALVMTLLYLAYKWLMATATFHRLNRAVLMAIYVVVAAGGHAALHDIRIGGWRGLGRVADLGHAGRGYRSRRCPVRLVAASGMGLHSRSCRSRSIHACRYSANGLGDMFRTTLQEERIYRGGDRQGSGTLQLGAIHSGAAMRPRHHSRHGRGS